MAKVAGWAKLGTALLLTGVLGAGAAVVALKTFFPEPKLRAMVLDGARKQLGRDVKLERIALGLRGLRLEGLQISESPDFAAGTFVSVESFRARPSWRALLRKKLVVATVEASGLKVSVVKRADGVFNFSNLASSAPATATPAAPAQGERPEFSIRHVRVSRGAILYRDEAAKESWELSEVALSADDLGLLAPFDVDASLRARGARAGRPIDAKLSFDGVIDPARGDASKLKVKARKFSVESEGLTVKGSADVDGLAPPRARFDAEVSAAGKTLVETSGEVRLSSAAGGDFLADVTAESAGLDTTALAKWLPAGTLPAVPVPAAKLKLKAERRGANLDVSGLALDWKDGSVKGRATAKGLGKSAPIYDGRFILDLVLPALAKGQYPFLKLPPELSLPSAKVQGAVTLAGDSAKLEDLKVTVPQGTASLSGSVARLGSAKPAPDVTVTLALSLPAVKAGELPVALPPSVPAGFVIPAVKVDGALALKGDDARFKALRLAFSGGKVVVGGAVLGVMGAKPRPELEVQAELALPALTDKDLPLAGVPAGLQVPPTSWEADLDYTLERLRVRKLHVKLGGNDLNVEGVLGDPRGRMAYDLTVKGRMSFAEITKLTPATRALELSGSAFTGISVVGAGDKPVIKGKAQFKGAGATVAGLPLSDFAGTVSVDEDKVESLNVTGKVADGNMKLSFTVDEWAKAPSLRLNVDLDRFDLGRFLDAKKRYDAEHPPKPAVAAKTGQPATEPPPLRSGGYINVGALAHPQVTVSAVKLSWDLNGISPNLRLLNGSASLATAKGRLRSAKELSAQNPALKVLLIPLAAIQGLGRAFGIPDLDDISVHAISGDYLISKGVMHVRDSQLDSDKVQASATGSVDLPHEALDLLAVIQVDGKLGRSAKMEIDVKGTISQPKPNPRMAKFIGETLLNLIPKGDPDK